jgi:hypothetical protein
LTNYILTQLPLEIPLKELTSLAAEWSEKSLDGSIQNPKGTVNQGYSFVFLQENSFWSRQRLTLLSKGYINPNNRYIEYVADQATLADKTANCPHTRRSESAVSFPSVSPKPQHPGSNPILPIFKRMEALGIGLK